MTPAVLRYRDFLSKDPFVHQQCRAFPEVTINKIHHDQANDISVSPRRSEHLQNTKAIAINTIRRGSDSYSGNSVSALTPQSTAEYHHTPPLKKRKLLFTPIRDGSSEADLSQHAPNCEEPLQNGILDYSKSSPNQSYGSKNFNFRTIATNFGVDGCITSNNEGRCPENEKLHIACTVSLVRADQNKPEVPTKLEINRHPRLDGSTSLLTPKNLSLPAPKEQNIRESRELEVAEGNETTSSSVAQNEVNVAANILKQRRSAVIERDFTPCETTPDSVREESEKSEDSPATKKFDFRTIAKNFGFRANNGGSRCSESESQRDPSPSKITVPAESDIPTVVQDYSAESCSKGKQLAPKRQRKRKNDDCWRRTNIKEPMKKKQARTLLIEPTSVTQYSSFNQWTGGRITVLARQENALTKPEQHNFNFNNNKELDKEKRAQSGEFDDHEKVSNENHGFGDIPPNKEASSGQQEVVSVSEEDHSDRGASADVCDASDRTHVASDHGTDDQLVDECYNDVTVEALLSFTTNFSNNNDVIEKVVNADAKLIEDVGSEAEKVVAYCDPQDFDISLDSNPDLGPENASGQQMKFKCPFCPQHFTCYIDIEGHSVDRHYESWNYTKGALLRTLVPYRPEGFTENHPRMKFKCVFCSKLFSDYGDLSGHLAERHYGHEPYECPFCAKRFKYSSSYARHLDSHILLADYPSYKCNACTAFFSSQWEVDLHAETHERLSPIIAD